jgi:hypothetical protein
MLKNRSTRNQVSRLWTQPRSRWSKVSTSCAERAQTSMSLNPWRRSLSDVQQRPCKTSHLKKRTLPGAWVFQRCDAPRRDDLPKESAL